MSAWERRSVYLANLLVGGTGLVYAVMRYFMDPVDEWAVVNHPWQPHVQHLHVLTAPLLVFASGLIWHRHILGGLRREQAERRPSGLGLLLALVPMVASGYLIQTTTDETWRRIWIGLHLVAAGGCVLGFLAHRFHFRSGAAETVGAHPAASRPRRSAP